MKKKRARIVISLKCEDCLLKYNNRNLEKRKIDFNYLIRKQKLQNKNKISSKSFTYITIKNRFNTKSRLTLKKYCSNCKKHTLHKEIK